MKFNESTLRAFAAPLSPTEDQKCLNAIHMVRDALKDLGFNDYGNSAKPLYEDTLAYSLEMRTSAADRKVKLFIQGSYANNTNVRTQSDVDIAVVQEEVFTTEYRKYVQPQNDADYNFYSVPAPSKSFKDEVQECLTRKFGWDVERKNKSIKIHGNTYRKDADSVPCRRYRDYRQDYRYDENNYIGGIIIYADNVEIIINYPEQHIANGRKKNIDTNHYYKKMVRIIKKMRYIMSDAGYPCADKVSSFGLESLLWNIPDSEFTKYTLHGFLFQHLLSYLRTNKASLSNYKEANGIKPLCPTQSDIDAYESFIDVLNGFFEYELTF